MTPFQRKLSLSAHIVVSVGWLGAVAAYLALAIVGLESRDPLLVRAAYRAMEVVGWWVIMPLSIITLAGGVLAAVGTNWGLLRHWWIVVKLALTVVSILVLARHMRAVTRMSDLASATALTGITLATQSAREEPERVRERGGTRPRWVLAVQLHLIGLVLVLAIVHLANGGLGAHR